MSDTWDSNIFGNAFQKLKDKKDRILAAPDKAVSFSREAFPNEGWDHGRQNALRHSALYGLMAKEIGSFGAHVLGTGMEFFTNDPRKYADPAFRRDTLNDLNNNSVGIALAGKTKSEAELLDQLKKYAQHSIVEQPPGVFSRAKPHLLRSQ